MAYEIVADLEDLKRRADSETGTSHEFFIALNFGLRSSKNIDYFRETDTFCILHEIDGSYDEDVTWDWLKENSNIPEALEKNALYDYNF